MHPPFFVVDHKIGPDIYHRDTPRPSRRRGKPETLNLSHVATGWPPVPLVDEATLTGYVPLPSGAKILLRPVLQVVPPPQRNLRHIVGRWLIRLGQRMILENRLG